MTHDPMLDGIQRYVVRNDYLVSRAMVGDEAFNGNTDVVLFSDLPALIERVREDEREAAVTRLTDYWKRTFDSGNVPVAEDELAAIRAREERSNG